jgi:cobalt-zinc-cadmium efflux system outer membrane protein
LAWLCLALGPAQPAAGQRVLGLEEALRIAHEKSPGLALAQADEERALAATRTARQYVNPSVIGMGGPFLARRSGVNEGAAIVVGFNQPIELPMLRSARRRAAGAGLESAKAGTQAAEAELVARVKRAFSDVLIAQQLLRVDREERDLLTQSRDRIERAVRVGEGPGLDLAQAETELLNASRDVVAAEFGLAEARIALASAVGDPDAGAFGAEGEIPPIPIPPLAELRARLVQDNPRVAEARREVERAESELTVERHRRFDGVEFQSDWVREPDNDILTFGLRVPLPIWNRRGGEIAEAQAGVKRARAALALQELALKRELEDLYALHRLASEQVELIEQGLIQQAQRALRGARAAYRSGERGILSYLDAQRTFREVRLDLLTARAQTERAAIEIERLAGTTR